MKENQWSEIIVSKYNMIIISDLPNFTRNEHSTIMCITQYIFWAWFKSGEVGEYYLAIPHRVYCHIPDSKSLIRLDT